MSTKVVLVIPPGTPGTTPNHEGAAGLGALEPTANAFRYAPHTVATMAAVLRESGYDVLPIDATAQRHDVVAAVRATLEAGPQLVGIFVSWATSETDQLFLEALRVALSRGVLTVAFGVSVRFMHASLREADHLLEGEPEWAFRALCDKLLRQGGSLPRVVSPATLGLAAYDHEGLIRDLDALPYPAWDLFPLQRYTHLSIMSSRGCPEQCVWCPYVVAQGHRFRACSPDRVVAELREIVQRYRPARVIFRDPVFPRDGQRVEQICRRIIGDRILRPGKRLLWECESRPEYLERRLLRLMNLAGCVGIKIGLETTDALLLQALHRLSRPNGTARYLARVASLARDCARLGIAYRLFVMAGLPGQTLASVQETAGFAQAVHPFSLSTKLFTRYPGLDLSAVSSLALADDTEAQEQLYWEAQQAIERQNHRPRRWRVMWERLLSRLASVLK